MDTVLENKDLLKLIFCYTEITGSYYKILCSVNKIFEKSIKEVIPNADTTLVDNLQEIIRTYNIEVDPKSCSPFGGVCYDVNGLDRGKIRISWTSVGGMYGICRSTSFYSGSKQKRCGLSDDKLASTMKRLLKNPFFFQVPKKSFDEYMELNRKFGVTNGNDELMSFITILMDNGIYPPKDMRFMNNLILYTFSTSERIDLLLEIYTVDELLKITGYSMDNLFHISYPPNPHTPIEYMRNRSKGYIEEWLQVTNTNPFIAFELSDQYEIPRFTYIDNKNISKYPELASSLGKDILNYECSQTSVMGLRNERIPPFVVIEMLNNSMNTIDMILYNSNGLDIHLSVVMETTERHLSNRIAIQAFEKYGYISNTVDISNLSSGICGYSKTVISKVSCRLLFKIAKKHGIMPKDRPYHFSRINGDEVKKVIELVDSGNLPLDEFLDIAHQAKKYSLYKVLRWALVSCRYSHKDVTSGMIENPKLRASILRNQS